MPFRSIKALMPKPLVTFAIATHNRGPIILDCLHRTLVNGLPAAQFDIRIVDNASTDGTPDLIAQHFHSIHLTRLAKNAGPVAKNIAIRESNAEFIVLLDDDAYPHPGSVPQMVRHFRDNPLLGAAVFDVTLPDGSKEASAYPDVFIGAGTGLRKAALNEVGSLPSHFFMQAEEYDLSFRLVSAGYSVQRFWDLPLTHLKTPGARIGQRTTRLDVRNNLYLLARYVPEPLCQQLAADWLSRYWTMALQRDIVQIPPDSAHGSHKQAFLRGSGEGLAKWSTQRENGQHLLAPHVIEQLFKFRQIRDRLGRLQRRLNATRLLFADWGKNMLAYHLAAQQLGLEVLAIIDDRLAGIPGGASEYRGVPLIRLADIGAYGAEAIVVSNLSPVQAPRRADELRRTLSVPVIDLFDRRDVHVHLGTGA